MWLYRYLDLQKEKSKYIYNSKKFSRWIFLTDFFSNVKELKMLLKCGFTLWQINLDNNSMFILFQFWGPRQPRHRSAGSRAVSVSANAWLNIVSLRCARFYRCHTRRGERCQIFTSLLRGLSHVLRGAPDMKTFFVLAACIIKPMLTFKHLLFSTDYSKSFICRSF